MDRDNQKIWNHFRSDVPVNQPLEISTNYKECFAQCLEPITAPLRPHSAVSGAGGVRTTNQQTSNSSSLVEAPSSSSSKGGGGTFSSSGHHKRSTSSGAQHHLHHPQRCELGLIIQGPHIYSEIKQWMVSSELWSLWLMYNLFSGQLQGQGVT